MSLLSLATSETALTEARRWREMLVRELKRSLCVDPKKEELVLKGSKELGLGLSLDLTVVEFRERGWAILVAEKDMLERKEEFLVRNMELRKLRNY